MLTPAKFLVSYLFIFLPYMSVNVTYCSTWVKRETNLVVCRFLQSPQCLLRYHQQVFAVSFTPHCSSIHLVWCAPCCCSIHLFSEEMPQLGFSGLPYNCLDTWYKVEPVPTQKSVLIETHSNDWLRKHWLQCCLCDVSKLDYLDFNLQTIVVEFHLGS